jgi:hypothetical protein
MMRVMDVDELCQEVRALRQSVLPFVGAGLVLDAGAPSVGDLAEDLARRFALEIGLSVVTEHPASAVRLWVEVPKRGCEQGEVCPGGDRGVYLGDSRRG